LETLTYSSFICLLLSGVPLVIPSGFAISLSARIILTSMAGGLVLTKWATALPLGALPAFVGASGVNPFRQPNAVVLAASSRSIATATLSSEASVSRRSVLFVVSWIALSPWTAASAASLDGPALRGLDEPAPEGEAPFRNLGDGLLVQEVSAGNVDGPRVGPHARVSLKYVMRRSNGYFIDASFGFDRFDNYSFTMGTGSVIPGFEKALAGLHPGSRRRIVVPPALGYTKGTSTASPGPIPPDWGARRSLGAHAREPILFEVLIERVYDQ
jgi:hypothetical protein